MGQMQQQLLAGHAFQNTVGINQYIHAASYRYLFDLVKVLWAAV